MPLPFVSRERYNEKLDEIKELKAELREARGHNPRVESVSAAVAARAQEIASGVVPMRPKLTLSSLMQRGTMDAQAAFRTGGESPSAILDKVQRRARATAMASAKPLTEEAS